MELAWEKPSEWAYRVAVIANREMLSLYFSIGKEITEKVKSNRWGAKVLDSISADLQNELPGLKGFSTTNLKRMKLFFTGWQSFFEISPTLSDQMELSFTFEISPTTSDQFATEFSMVSFSHHYEILVATKSMEERQFYISMIAREFWTLNALRHHLKSNLFAHRSTLPNNFSNTISNNDYLGKMNFYLSALDELVKQPHENSSIGIILCKEKKYKTVEFSFRDFNKAMGVATYKTASELPEAYKGILPDAEILKKLMV